jgi:hypothetical protein
MAVRVYREAGRRGDQKRILGLDLASHENQKNKISL